MLLGSETHRSTGDLVRFSLRAVVAAVLVLPGVAAVGALPAQAGVTAGPALLNAVPVAAETTAATYDRALFEHWIDADGDGADPREEVLLEESTATPVTGAGCTVTGQWTSWYDGAAWTDPAAVDIDH